MLSCLNADKVNTKIDHAPLKGIFNIDLSNINNPGVIELLEKTLHFNLEVEHVSGKTNKAADALSRMGCDTAEAPDESREYPRNIFIKFEKDSSSRTGLIT